VTFGFVDRTGPAPDEGFRRRCDRNATQGRDPPPSRERFSANWIAAVDEARRDISFDPPGSDGPREYPTNMPQDRDNLKVLAAGRRSRLQSNGRPRFDLTHAEIERSTQTAMRLADASKSQAEARANPGTSLPA
jgi:hypothetical protein